MTAPPTLPKPTTTSAITRALVVRAIWLGFVVGAIEAAVPLTQKFAFGRMRIYMNLHILWMAPLVNAMLFTVIALLLTAIVLSIRRFANAFITESQLLAAASGVLVALAAWSVTLLYPALYSWAAVVLSVGIGVQAIRWLSPGGGRFDRMTARTIVPLGAVVALCAITVVIGSRWREQRALAALPTARDGAPNVLLLILDTVRAQSLSLYGASRPTTPRLQALGDEGVVFDRAITTAPWTLPSHVSMLTGKYPHELSADWLTPLDDTTPTLAGVLQQYGYANAGFVANPMVAWETGIDRGFHHYEDYRVSIPQLVLSSSILREIAYWPRLRRRLQKFDMVNRVAASVLDRALLQWIDRVPRQRPFFAMVNYLDAHEAYLPRDPFRTMFGPDTARRNGMIRYGVGGIPHRTHKQKMLPHQVQAELDAYEGAIAALDHDIGALADSLQQRGLLDETVVIVTSDHGEQFGEHGEFTHGGRLYVQALHVPLLIRAPQRVPAGRRVTEFVTLRDLAATVLSLATKSSELPGRSLTHHWEKSDTAAPRVESSIISSISNARWSTNSPPSLLRGIRSVVRDGMLIIEDVHGKKTTELFDLRRDPRGETDLAADSAWSATIAAGRATLAPVLWRSQARDIARKAGDIGAIQP